MAMLRQAGPAGVLAVLALVLPPLGSILLFWAMATTELGPWLRSHGLVGAVAFSAAFALLAGLALLPTYAQCALAGWAFGFTMGLSASLVGFTAGALLGYAIGRQGTGRRIEDIVASQPKWLAVREVFLGPAGQRPGFWRTLGMVTLLRLPPNSPFALANLLMASVRVPIGPYLLGTLIGMAPRSALAVMIGSAIQQAFSKDALSAASPTWVRIVAIGAAIAVVVVIGLLANRAIERFESQIQGDGAKGSNDSNATA
jgi:uncharacterized membrane protein YdjX (TVP38/TMEM64 family)